jgi:predicted nucleotidyltransferase
MKEFVSLLRARPDVRLAVVYGSVAHGEDHPGSDLDLLVSFASEEAYTSASLAVALTEETGCRVQVVSLSTARRAPLLLVDILHEGRVLLDRDDEWSALKRQEREIQRQAVAADAELDRRIAELAELVVRPIS